MIGKCAFLLGVEALSGALLGAAHRIDGGINIDPLHRIEPNFRQARAVGLAPYLPT